MRVNDRNTFIGGDASGVYPLVRGMYNKREDKIDAFGWNNEITAGSVKIVADLNYSKATRDELNLENNLQRAPMPQLDTVGVSVVGNGFSQLTPGMNYSIRTSCSSPTPSMAPDTARCRAWKTCSRARGCRPASRCPKR